jgi:methylmalonyl-CoA mutase cobalamin-binding domain/chain
MSETGWKDNLAGHMTDLQLEAVLGQVREALQSGDDPLMIVKVCEDGLKHVGELYEKGEYFLAGLIMAGEIFRQAMELIVPHLDASPTDGGGTVLLGTVKGDIHDMGKNLVAALLRCHGFNVQDLGVDVTPAEFVREVQARQPDVVGLSGLLTSSHTPMREVVQLLRASVAPDRQPRAIIIGGSAVNEAACRFVGADFWATDAMHGVRLCLQVLTQREAEL